MTRVRAAVVRKEALVGVAEALGVGGALRLGKGEAGWEKAGILSDAMEALIGAVYLDGGWKLAEKLIMRHWGAMIEERALAPDARDAKTELQERLAAARMAPEYRMEGKGPAHARRYQVEVWVGPAPWAPPPAGGSTKPRQMWGEGEGSSRRLAEQQAAAAALEKLYSLDQVIPLHPTPPVPAPALSASSPMLERIRRWSDRRSGRKP